MVCVACGGTAITERSDRTAQGYRVSAAAIAGNGIVTLTSVGAIEPTFGNVESITQPAGRMSPAARS